MEYLKIDKIEKEIPELANGVLTILLEIALSIQIKSIAIVGGVVRDLINKSNNKDYKIIFNDLDIIIEGDAIYFTKQLQNFLGIDRVNIIRNNTIYKTSEIIIDGIKVDIASAREENYAIPGENPIVRSTTIEKDLIRRDFSMNAMAIDLKEHKLIDLFCGLDAISKKKIEFLHDSSVLEDPTRIIRASRYSAKLGFNLSNQSFKQIQHTISTWPWNWHINDKPNLAPSALSIRLKMELALLFQSKDWENALKSLKSMGGLKIIDMKLHNDESLIQKILLAKNSHIEPITAFVYESENPLFLCERLQLDQHQKDIINGAIQLNKYLKSIIETKEYKSWSASKWTTILEESNIHEKSFQLEICRNNHLKEYLCSWLNNWRNIKSPIKGEDLIAKGWKQGPEIGLEIRRQRMILIDKQNTI